MKSLQKMLAFMAVCTAVMSMSRYNLSDGFIPQRGCSKCRRNRDLGDGLTIKQKKARKRAKNNRRKCKKR